MLRSCMQLVVLRWHHTTGLKEGSLFELPIHRLLLNQVLKAALELLDQVLRAALETCSPVLKVHRSTPDGCTLQSWSHASEGAVTSQNATSHQYGSPEYDSNVAVSKQCHPAPISAWS
jgi:hypothetical protein